MGERIRVGIIGTSWWTELMHLPALASHPGARIAAICGRTRSRTEALAAAWDIPAAHGDYRALLARPDLDAVIVATPDDSHAEMTLAALGRGLHVLCEKPLANSAEEARAMLDAAETAGVRHMVAFTWRFLPEIRHLRRLIETGSIGRCHQMTARFIGDYALDPAYQWRFDGTRAHGVLGDLGSHLIDLFRYLLGEVSGVSADLCQAVDRSALADPASAPSNDCGFVMLRGAGGAQGLLHVSAAAPGGDRDMRLDLSLHGAAGTLELGLIFGGGEMGVSLRGAGRGTGPFVPLSVPDASPAPASPAALFEPFTRMPIGPRLFIDAIRDDLPIPTTFRDGWLAQQIVDAALKSDRERRWIEIGPR